MQVNMVQGKTKNPIEVADAVFGQAYNEALIHQVIVAYLAKARSGTHAQKTRSEVRGGGKKPWRQKGTGRARAGSIRSPLWRGGGKTFAAKTQSYDQKVNKKMYRVAMRSILSELIRSDRLVVVEELSFEQPKTKLFVEFMNTLGLKEALIVVDELTENLFWASSNIPLVDVLEVEELNPVILLRFEKVVVTQAALQRIEEQLS